MTQITNEFLVQYLKERATEEAKEGEFHPEEHTFWITADRIQELVNIIATDSIPQKWW